MPLQPSGAAQKILVADDDDLLSEVLLRTLGRHGYRVTCAPHGVLSSELADDADLVILDANIPGADFATTLRLLRHGGIPVLVLTGEPAPPVGVSADEFLAKPVDLVRLLAAVRRFTTPASAA